MLRNSLTWIVGLTLCVSCLMGCGPDNGDQDNRSCSLRADCPQGQRCEANTCTTQTKACTQDTQCAFDEYCASGSCAASSCESHDQCEGAGYVCAADRCRPGCTSTADCAGAGETCNVMTLTCERTGCTATGCAPFQMCDAQQSRCVPTGGCTNDLNCVAYGAYINDDNDYICGAGGQCIIKPPCESDNDCNRTEGEICEQREGAPNVCRLGCRDDSQCGTNQFCDLGPDRCVVGCASDNDCAGIDPNESYVCIELQCERTCTSANQCGVTGQICSGQPGICQGCTSDNQCPGDQDCDKTRGATPAEQADPDVGLCTPRPPSCPDDGFGLNSAQDRPYVVPSLPFVTGEDGVPTPLFCQQNAQAGDYFQIDAQPGQLIDITVTYAPMGANLDVQLLNNNGAQVVASIRPPDVDMGREQLRYGTQLGGRFLVRVSGSVIAQNIPYTLSINVSDPPACVDDAFEPNDTLEAPAPLEAGTSHPDLQVCGADPDFYRISVSANQIVRVATTAPRQLGELEVLVTTPTGTPVNLSPVGDRVDDVEFSVTQAGDYIIQVRPTTGIGNINYSLQWTQRDNQCADVLEPNNSCAAADTSSPIGPGTYTGLNLCTDEDWYRIELLPRQRVIATATYNPNQAAGFIDMRLRGPNSCNFIVAYNTRLTEPNSPIYRERIEHEAPQGGTFYLAATLQQGLNVPHSLEIEIQDGPPCQEDPYNATSLDDAYAMSRASVLDNTENVLLDLRYCDTNEDFYSLDLQEGDEVRWVVVHNVAGGDLDAEIIDPDGMTVRASGTSTTDDEEVTYTVPTGAAGTYTLRVFTKTPLRTNYRLLAYVNGVGPVDPVCPDIFENNDARAEARVLDPGTYSLLVCGGPSNVRDDDWYTTCVAPGETLNVTLAFEHAQGNISLALFQDNPMANALVTSATNTNAETVSYTSPRAQCLSYQVFGAGTAVFSNSYELTVDVTPAPSCVEDRFAGNHTAATAQPIDAPGLYTNLNKCDGQDDWFSFEVREGQKAEVYVNFIERVSNVSQGDIDVEIYDAVGATTPVFSGTATSANESVIFTAPNDPATTPAQPQTVYTYYARILTKTPARVPYDLLMYRDLNGDESVQGPEDRLCPDPLENNDTKPTARPIPVGNYTDLSLCAAGGASIDLDYYSVFVPAGATLNVDLTFSHALGNIQLDLVSATANTVLANSRSTDDDESLSYTNMGVGTDVIIHVYNNGFFARNYYSMNVELAFAGVCDEDMVSGADKATAAPTTGGRYSGLAMCEQTEDWFALSLMAGDSVFAAIELSNRFGNLDMELINSADVVIASATTDDNVEVIDTTVAASGTYYLRVFPRDGAFIRTTYDLFLSLDGDSAGAQFCPDPYTRNTSASEAPALLFAGTTGVKSYSDMIACGAQEDWYQVNITTINSDYRLRVFFDASAAVDLDVEIVNSMGAVMVSGTTTGNDEFVTFRPTVSGAYFIKVFNKATNPGVSPYSLFFDLANAPCKDDEFEPNNTSATFKPLPSLNRTYAMGNCVAPNNATPGEDYFRFTPTTGAPITVTLYHDSALVDVEFKGRVPFLLNGNVVRFEQAANVNTPNRKTVVINDVLPNEYIELQISNVSGSGPYFLKIED